MTCNGLWIAGLKKGAVSAAWSECSPGRGGPGQGSAHDPCSNIGHAASCRSKRAILNPVLNPYTLLDTGDRCIGRSSQATKDSSSSVGRKSRVGCRLGVRCGACLKKEKAHNTPRSAIPSPITRHAGLALGTLANGKMRREKNGWPAASLACLGPGGVSKGHISKPHSRASSKQPW